MTWHPGRTQADRIALSRRPSDVVPEAETSLEIPHRRNNRYIQHVPRRPYDRREERGRGYEHRPEYENHREYDDRQEYDDHRRDDRNDRGRREQVFVPESAIVQVDSTAEYYRQAQPRYGRGHPRDGPVQQSQPRYGRGHPRYGPVKTDGTDASHRGGLTQAGMHAAAAAAHKAPTPAADKPVPGQVELENVVCLSNNEQPHMADPYNDYAVARSGRCLEP